MLADIGRRSRGGTMARLGTILVDLNANRRSGTDNRTNLEFYQEEVERRCGIRLSDPIIYEAFTYYDREVLPYKNDDVINAHAMPLRALYQPQLSPGGHRVPHGLGRPGRCSL